MLKVDIDKSRILIKKLIKEKYGTQKSFCKQQKEHEGNLSKMLKGTDPIRRLSPTKIIELEEKLGVPVGSVLFPDYFTQENK